MTLIPKLYDPVYIKCNFSLMSSLSKQINQLFKFNRQTIKPNV